MPNPLKGLLEVLTDLDDGTPRSIKIAFVVVVVAFFLLVGVAIGWALRTASNAPTQDDLNAIQKQATTDLWLSLRAGCWAGQERTREDNEARQIQKDFMIDAAVARESAFRSGGSEVDRITAQKYRAAANNIKFSEVRNCIKTIPAPAGVNPALDPNVR